MESCKVTQSHLKSHGVMLRHAESCRVRPIPVEAGRVTEPCRVTQSHAELCRVTAVSLQSHSESGRVTQSHASKVTQIHAKSPKVR
jgi:hypothetical protein